MCHEHEQDARIEDRYEYVKFDMDTNHNTLTDSVRNMFCTATSV
jgi:hypothetical protein